MAVVFLAKSNAANTFIGGAETLGITVDASADLAIAEFFLDDTATTITAASINGVGMSQFIDEARLKGYKLPNPATGAQTLSYTGGGTGGPGYILVRYYSGAGSVGTPVISSPTANVSDAVASATNDLVVDALLVHRGLALLTVGASQTQHLNQTFNYSGKIACASEEAGAATVTMSWTAVPSVDAGSKHAAYNIAASGGATATAKIRRRRDFMSYAALAAPAAEIFGRIFQRSRSGLMLPAGV